MTSGTDRFPRVISRGIIMKKTVRALIMVAPQYDSILVGGGRGGITCAALLQKWGLKTLVVDHNKTTGGKAMSVERDGFKYEPAQNYNFQCMDQALSKPIIY